jgi:hypothetical protein
MAAKQRFFQFSEQWCAIHIPDRPNGFALLILGDVSHFVDDETSLWIQHAGKNKLLHELLQRGYTIFYSHLYGANWGSPKAVKLAKQLMYYVLKTEILNERIYVLAEGMGALVALPFMDDVGDHIRAVALLNPCIYLHDQLQYEKEHKFFYKRLMRQLKQAYGEEDMERHIQQPKPPVVPVKIWQVSGVNPYPPTIHARAYAQAFGVPVSYHLPEKKYTFAQAIHTFFEQYNDV